MKNITLGEALAGIKKLNDRKTFWEDVKNLIGFYEHKFWEDWDIKSIQRAADNRYEEIGGFELNTNTNEETENE